MSDRLAARAWLRQWIGAASGTPPSALDDGAALFADGPLDSTDFVELILAIEERTGRTIDVAQLRPEAFRTVDAIVGHFFGANDDAAQQIE